MLVAGCGGSDEADPAAAATSSTRADTADTGDATTVTATGAPTKPGTGVSSTLMLSESFAAIDEPVGFGAEFVAADAGDSSEFTQSTEGVASLEVPLPDEPAADGVTVSFDGTVGASGTGSGVAQVGLEITSGGSVRASRLTVFVEADLGYAAYGDESESATRRLLADGLLEAGVIDEAAHAERLASIEGGTG